ncbi:CSC1-like protein At4g02900 [Prosopis cineraria]|uniref:CSC1-like protein At4g02900 n=1 Tax=Prosopis cineraria TaxID=364024 RepID=UPI0024105F37|nr:CSC1-like protein At4g02900 [Prosopis cineraria]
MATLSDIGLSAAINLLSALAFLVAFAMLRLQPVNDRVYFPKWYLKGIRGSPTIRNVVNRFVNLDVRTYIKFLSWMPAALSMPQPELIDHAGLDSAVYIRIYLLGLKIFGPVTLLTLAVLVPVNWMGKTLESTKDLKFSNIDKISISNIPPGSNIFWVHSGMSYLFTFWTCFCLFKEYKIITDLRLRFLAAENRRPDQFTVLVRNVPPDPDETISEHIEHFFCVNHPDHYLLHNVVYNANKLASIVAGKKKLQNWQIYYQNKFERSRSQSYRPTARTGFLGLCGKKVDAIDYYAAEIARLSEEEEAERTRVSRDPEALIPAAFVSFRSRWGAAVCAQTQQSSNPSIWLTEWAPEPRDVCWENLAIPYVELSIRRLLMAIALFFLIFFFMIPIALVQSLANIESIQKGFPFLRPLLQKQSVKSFIQGFLPGLALKIFLILVPTIVMLMSKIEGHRSFSSLERRSAAKYYFFILVNVFLGSIVAGTAFQQLEEFVKGDSTKFAKMAGATVPMKATFYITYIMVDGWSGVAAEILRITPFAIFHLKNTFLVKTEEDRVQAMNPGSLNFAVNEPRLQLYFMLGHLYSPVTPALLPFIVIFFAFAYLVFRHQIINVYHQSYESAAAFWPDVHRRVLIGLFISQILLMGLLSTKDAKKATIALVALPVFTIWFHSYCKGRFESAFVKFSLEDAMVKDTLEKAIEPTLNMRLYLQDAYIHPDFKGGVLDKPQIIDEEENNPLIQTKRARRSSKQQSEVGSSEASITPTAGNMIRCTSIKE